MVDDQHQSVSAFGDGGEEGGREGGGRGNRGVAMVGILIFLVVCATL